MKKPDHDKYLPTREQNLRGAQRSRPPPLTDPTNIKYCLIVFGPDEELEKMINKKTFSKRSPPPPQLRRARYSGSAMLDTLATTNGLRRRQLGTVSMTTNGTTDYEKTKKKIKS